MPAIEHATGAPVTVTRIPRPDEPVPAIAAPAALVFVGGLALWGASTALALTGAWPLLAAVLPNAVASYLLFTVAHDASHRSLSSHEAVNVWLGRVSLFFFAPQAGFRTWRFIHMQHHRFTNHDDGRDPDQYTHRGPRWQLVPRWLTIDLYYLRWYAPQLGSRPRRERIELAVFWALLIAVVVAAVLGGLGLELVVLYLLPMRLAIGWLGLAFDYLPHNGLHLTPSEDRFKTTRNRVGLERLLSPLLLYQNYHLVHHLHPTIPFHRYLAVWRRHEDRYLDGDPELTDVRGRAITADEYRRLRELAEHH
ncbi:MAG: fatty acid desaturase [Solirubrobacteraceae bacterium]